MAIRDEIKKGREHFLAGATKKEKFKYFVDYYGLTVAIIVLVLAFGIYFIIDAVTRPKDVLNGIYLNLSIYRTTDIAEELGQNFLKEQNIDTSKYAVNTNGILSIIDSDDQQNYTTIQALTAQISAGAVDFIVGTSEQLISYAYGGTFTDLTTILTEEQIERYEPYFRYIDQAVVEEREAADEAFEDTADIPLPDCAKPEEMKKPIPILIDVSAFESMQKLYKDGTANLCYGIVSNGENQGNALKFLDFITK